MTYQATETCADCGKPISMHEASYYRKDPSGEIGQSFHSYCGDPFGTKAKDAEIERLQDAKRRALAIADERGKENDRLRVDLAAALEDRARFPDKPDSIGRMIEGHIGSLKLAKEEADRHAVGAILQNAETVERLRAKLEQIAVCCTDNMGPRCNHRMALDFVRQIANSADEQRPAGGDDGQTR